MCCRYGLLRVASEIGQVAQLTVFLILDLRREKVFQTSNGEKTTRFRKKTVVLPDLQLRCCFAHTYTLSPHPGSRDA